MQTDSTMSTFRNGDLTLSDVKDGEYWWWRSQPTCRVADWRDDLLYDSPPDLSLGFSFPPQSLFFLPTVHATLHFEGESHKYQNYLGG